MADSANLRISPSTRSQYGDGIRKPEGMTTLTDGANSKLEGMAIEVYDQSVAAIASAADSSDLSQCAWRNEPIQCVARRIMPSDSGIRAPALQRKEQNRCVAHQIALRVNESAHLAHARRRNELIHCLTHRIAPSAS